MTTYRIRCVVKDGDFEYVQYTDMSSLDEPTKEEQVKCTWLEYYYDDEDPEAKLNEAWKQYQRDGFLELDCDYRIVEDIEIDEKGTRQLAMLPLLKEIYSAMEKGSITDSGSELPYAISTMIAKGEGDE